MAIVLRVVLGLVLMPFVYGLVMLLFGLVTGLVNAVAYLLARGLRRLFGVRGTWVTGTTIAVGAASIAKTLASVLLMIGVFMFAAIPPAGTAAGWAITAAWSLALAVWMPCLFAAALFARGDDLAVIEAELDGGRRY